MDDNILAHIKFLLQKTDIEAARLEIAAVLADRPDDFHGLWLSGLASYHSGDYERAKLEIAEVVSHYPGFAEARYFYADLLDRIGDAAGAIEHCQAALLLDPSDERPYLLYRTRLEPKSKVREFQHRQADVVFFTGSIFLERRFDDSTVDKEALGGSESSLIYMAREMARRGLKVIVFCNCAIPGIYHGVEWGDCRDFPRYVREFPIDVLISLRFVTPFLTKVKARIKILWLQDVIETLLYENTDFRTLNVDYFFVLSDYHRRNLLGKYPELAERTLKTRNGFARERFKEKIAREKTSLIYISRPSRGLALLLRIFADLGTVVPGLELHVATYSQRNDLADDEEIAPLLSELSAPGVHFHRGLAKSELSTLLHRSTLMIYPNITNLETSCIAAIEAQAAGVPVITSNLGALPETVEHGIGGIILPYDSHLGDSLVCAGSELLTTPARLQAMSKRAKNRMFALYSWETIASEWLKFLGF